MRKCALRFVFLFFLSLNYSQVSALTTNCYISYGNYKDIRFTLV